MKYINKHIKLIVEQYYDDYVLSVVYDYENDGNESVEVFPIAEMSDRESLEELIYRIVDLLGFPENKFASDNFKISWDKKGSKAN